MSWESPSDRSVWNGNWETEASPVVMTINPEEQGVLSEQYQPVTECVPAEMPLEVPVTGESFCECPTQTDLSSHTQPDPHTPECTCGEDESGCVWVWDGEYRSPAMFLSCSSRKVCFHPDYSCGTAALRGSEELRHGQHFWEIKMTSPVYGTDMMVGIGTAEVNLDKYTHSFCSLLGADDHSWGLSYTGFLHHKGSKVSFSPRFGQGSIIGLHLDTWHGTLTFYKNRQWIGVVSAGLRNKSFYPMVCSTAAKSSMKLISSFSTPTSLRYLCCAHLRRYLPDAPKTLDSLPLPPGLKLQISQQLGWVLRLRTPEAPVHSSAEDAQQGPVPDQDADHDLYPDSTSYPDDAVAVCPDSAPCTPAGTYLTHYPDSASYDALDDANAAYPDSAPCTPTYTHLTSDPSSASCAPVHTHLTSHPNPFPPADTHLTSYPDSASCTPADTHLTSYPDSASCTPADTHLTSYPDSTSCTPGDTHLTSYSDSASCRDVSLHADPDLFSNPGSCSDPTSCPCCDAPLSFVTCDTGDYHSCASCCSGPASRPASPLPDHPYGSASSLPDSTHSRPSSASGTDTDECSSETCQRKRCRWT